MNKCKSPAMVAEAIRLYNEYKSGNAVAKRLGVSPPTIYTILSRNGVAVPGWSDPKPLRRKFNGAVADRLIFDYQAGMKLDDLTSKYECGRVAVRECVRRSGVKLRDHGGQRRRILKSEESDIVRMFRDDGLTQYAIANKLRCQQSTVSRILIAHGIRTRTGYDSHGSWNGGTARNGEGYLLQLVKPDHKMASMRGRNGYILQHRLVMAESLGRPLNRLETVHHINGDKTDNRIENLQLRQGNHGNGVCMQCQDCGSHNVSTIKISERVA